MADMEDDVCKAPQRPICYEPCRQDVALPARKKRCGRVGCEWRVIIDVARQGGREGLGWSWSTRRRWTQGAFTNWMPWMPSDRLGP